MGAREYTEKVFGFPTRVVENPVVASVDTTAILILRGNPDRIGWLIVNLSANTLYIGYGSDVSASKGIALGNGGGTASSKISDDGEAVAYEVWAVATGAGSAVYVVEYEKR